MNGPKIWLPLLASVKAVFGDALIAGGSPRDYAVNKNIKPKDIDVFVAATSEMDFELAIPDFQSSSNNPYNLRLLLPDQSAYTPQQLADGNCVGVLEGRFGEGSADVSVNIIGKDPAKIADPNLLMEDFDHSLCQFWTYGGRIYSTDAAAASLVAGKIEIFKPGPRTTKRLFDLTRRKPYASFKWDKPEPKMYGEPYFEAKPVRSHYIDWGILGQHMQEQAAVANQWINV